MIRASDLDGRLQPDPRGFDSLSDLQYTAPMKKIVMFAVPFTLISGTIGALLGMHYSPLVGVIAGSVLPVTFAGWVLWRVQKQ